MLQKIFPFRHSIFAKLFATVLCMCLIVNVLVTGSIRFLVKPSQETESTVSKNVRRYAGFLLHSLGPQPTREALDDLSRETGMQFRWESDGRALETTGFNPKPIALDFEPFSNPPPLTVTEGSARFTVQFPAFLWIRNLIPLLVLMLALTLTIAVAYGIIRRFLIPINDLMKAVDAINEGDFSQQVATRASDETSRLAQSFNTMVSQIRDMMKAKEQLLLDVSHELRTPLTRMRLSSTFFPESKARDYLDKDIALMEAMVNELLETHRISSIHGQIHRVEVDVCSHLREIMASFQGRRPGVRGSIEAGVRAEVDSGRLGSLWRNLIDNALKYSNEDGEPVEVSLQDKNEAFVVVVSDRGLGLAAADLPHIFEPFYRVDKSRTPHAGGFGLGLSLCLKIVQAHSGTIQVESPALGMGTRVTVRIPKSAGGKRRLSQI